MIPRILLILGIILLINLSTAQSQGSDESVMRDLKYVVTVEHNPVLVTVSRDLSYENLKPGVSYKTVATDAGPNPNIIPANGNEIFTPAQIEIEGDPYTNILISFALPSRLFKSDEELGYIDMLYDGQSASIVDPANGHNEFFNPQYGVQFTLPGYGKTAFIYLGGNPIVSTYATIGEYTGVGIVTVDYLAATF